MGTPLPDQQPDETMSVLLSRIKQLEVQNAQLQAELDANSNTLTIQRRADNRIDMEKEMKLCFSNTGTDEHSRLFTEYYHITPDEAQKLFKLKGKWHGYKDAITVLTLGADGNHTGYGAPPSGVDYGFQGVYRIVKECLARDDLDIEVDYYENPFRELDEPCGEFWEGWNR